jgi:hypothetical protein
MAFERMRLIDMAHYWAKGTHTSYSAKLGIIRNFGANFGFQVLKPTPLPRPPAGPEIPLMWCQEAYSLRPGHSRRQDGQDDLTLAFSTVRSLRSAASQYFAWDLMVAHPNEAYLDDRKRIIKQACRPTDGLGPTFHAGGMSSRIGDEARPSVALLDCHVRALDQDLDGRYRAARRPRERRKVALAGLANLTLWLGWLRSSEVFGLHWGDFSVLEPCNGPQEDLPFGCGAVTLRLAPETKSSRTKRADVCVAYETLSGYHIGKWFHRARVATGVGPDWTANTTRVFIAADGSPWTSLHFRQHFLYPSLRAQQAAGDPYLRPYHGGVGNTLETKFWSLHCYRRGARSHVSRGGVFGRHRFRKATLAQIYEHARWRRKRSGESIDVLYREWTLREFIRLTLYSM